MAKWSSSKAPKLPWKTRISVSVLSFVTDIVRRPDGTLNRRLLDLLDFPVAGSPFPHLGVRSADITVDSSSRNLWFRLFVPSGDQIQIRRRRIAVVVFFHGGGFAYLSPASPVYDAVCRRIASRIPAIVISVAYRRSPEHRFPAPYDDGIDVLRFLASGGLSAVNSEAADLADLEDIFLAGDSAGANIAHNVARRWEGSSAAAELRGLVAIQPFFGGEERVSSEIRLEGAPVVSMKRTDWLWKAFLPEGEDRDHEAANVFGPRAAAMELGEGFPPAMVVVGGFDPLQDRQRMYAEGLRARGKEAVVLEFPDAIHAFYVFPELGIASQLLDEIKSFVEGRRSSRSNGGGGHNNANSHDVVA